MSAAPIFPPDFAGNPWSYGFALFGTVLIASLSLAQLLGYALERRRAHRVHALVKNPLAPEPVQPWDSALSVHRGILIGLLLALFLPTSTKAAVLLTWGEVDLNTMTVIYLANYLANGFASVPFCAAMLLWCWASQAIPQKLAEPDLVPLPPLSFRMLRDKMKIAVVVFVIAVGVTLGKAGVA